MKKYEMGSTMQSLRHRRRYEIKAMIWLHDGPAGWHFVTLPQNEAREIRAHTAGLATRWGSIRVVATIGDVRWQTSLFPDRKRKSYLLPLKRAVLKAEGIKAGDRIMLTLDV
ncbi:DUF1905 domain-containing protein [Bradyrhizobium erythrophlei]|uniref:DUF1905 domain-containing protein n=1 Tax=Bradyrhizobium erythrophlei TaxID=1437360 RepID=UPI0035EBC6A3